MPVGNPRDQAAEKGSNPQPEILDQTLLITVKDIATFFLLPTKGKDKNTIVVFSFIF